MTALQKYIRLEAPGQWQESPAHAPREVVVSFGKTTLVLSDFDDRPLTHWALAGIGIVGTGPGVTYALDAAAEESLLIDDAEMTAAIAEVTAEARAMAAQATIPRQGRRWPLIILAGLALAVLAVWKGPEALRAQALNLIPQEKATLVGRDVVSALGVVCASSADLPGLARLVAVLELPRGRSISVARIPVSLAVVAGGDVVIGDDFLGQLRTPDALAGWVLMAHLADPGGRRQLGDLMQNKTLADLGGFMLDGEITKADIATMARDVADAEIAPTADRLRAAQAGLTVRGLADAGFAASVERLAPELPALTTHVSEGKPILRDQAWVAIQQACAN